MGDCGVRGWGGDLLGQLLTWLSKGCGSLPSVRAGIEAGWDGCIELSRRASHTSSRMPDN